MNSGLAKGSSYTLPSSLLVGRASPSLFLFSCLLRLCIYTNVDETWHTYLPFVPLAVASPSGEELPLKTDCTTLTNPRQLPLGSLLALILHFTLSPKIRGLPLPPSNLNRKLLPVCQANRGKTSRSVTLHPISYSPKVLLLFLLLLLLIITKQGNDYMENQLLSRYLLITRTGG